MTAQDTVTPEAIRAAISGIPAVFRNSPQFLSEALTAALGRPVVVKADTVNPLGCFKGRGTWLAVQRLVADGEVGEGRGLVVASAGNFGQGVAYAARAMGIPVTVFGSSRASATKLDAMRRFGAEVRLAGGIGTWLKAASPRTSVIGVQAERAPAMTLSWQQHRPVETASADTVADGIATRVPVPEALALMRGSVDEMRLVSEEAILAAQEALHAALPLAVEPSAAAAWAAARQGDAGEGAVAIILTGGNLPRQGA